LAAHVVVRLAAAALLAAATILAAATFLAAAAFLTTFLAALAAFLFPFGHIDVSFRGFRPPGGR
jgi:hypothetical protein